MTYIISNIKKSLFITLISILTLSMFTSNTYAGTGSIIQRGDTASVSWNVSNAICIPITGYSSTNDNVKSNWENGQAGSGSYSGVGTSNFGGQKVTAAPGSYTFYCTVPNNTASGGTCTGTSGTGAQNVCWDSAVLTVNDCMPGSAWVASSLSCQVQVCTANTQTTYGCSQTDANGNNTKTCNSSGTDSTGVCNLTCNNGFNFNPGTGKCEPIICTANAVNVTTGCTQVSNGSVTRNCNSYGTAWTGTGVCTLTSCVPGWTIVGGACVPNVCPNGATDRPAPCTQCAAGMAWNTSNGQCEACNGGCSGAGGSQSNPNGSLICTNGANNPKTCNTCTGIKNFISNSCQTPVGNFNTITDCTISNNGSNCTKNISWTTSGTNSIRLENCTTNVVLANNISGGAQSLNNVIINYPGTCLRIMDINHNYEIARTTVNANCNSGWSWNVDQGRCRPSACAPHNACDNPSACNSAVGKNYFPAVDDCLAPTGGFTGTPYICNIIDGQGSCKKVVSWSTVNTLAVTLKDSSGAYISVLGSGAYTYNTGGGVTVPHGNATYNIYDIDGTGNVGTNRLLDSVTINARCNNGSTFVGGVCTPILCTPGEIKTPSTCPQTDSNGTVSQICNVTGTAWGSCTVTACNPGYQNNGGVCTAIVCANGMNYIVSIPGCRAPTGNMTTANNCDILNNQSNCNTNIVWVNNFTPSGIRLENCTAGANPVVLYTGNATNYNFNAAYGVNCLRLVDVGTNSILGGIVNVSGICADGTAWHVSNKCRRISCDNGCNNAPNCNAHPDKNYFPLPINECRPPSGNFTSTPGCTIATNASNCLTTLSWNVRHGIFRFEDCNNVSGDLGAYLPNVPAGVGSGQVTVPYNSGCYRLVDKGTGLVVARVDNVSGTCLSTDQWSGASNKCLERLTINAIPSSRYFGLPYTFNWNTNGDSVDVIYGGNTLNNVPAVDGYNVTGNSGEPALNNQANTITFNLIARKLDLVSGMINANVSLLYRAIAAIGTPTMTGGIVSVPLSCSYSTAYTLNNTSTGVQLKSASGLDKTNVTTDTYNCPLATCVTGITLNCISDDNDNESAILDLAALRARVGSFSVSPSSVEKNSINNKIALSWSVSALDSCYVSVSASSNAPLADELQEALTLNSTVRANSNINPLPTLKSKDVTAGTNVINGVTIKYPKVFSLVCGDSNRDGVPDGTYAGDATAIKRVRVNISDTKEQ